MKKILANDGIDAAGKQLLEKAGFNIITDKVAQDSLIQYINDNNVQALTVRSATQVRKNLIDACPNLKIIGRGGVGMDNIDVDYARSKGIEVINTPAASSHSVAELVFAHLFSMSRFLYDSNKNMHAKGATEFNTLKKNYAQGIELKDKTIGIIGFGRIGQEVAKMAYGLGMHVWACDNFISSAKLTLEIHGHNPYEFNVHTVTMEQVLKHSDFITVHVPGGKLITKKEIDLMKNGVCVVNAARGGVIDEQDLLDGLNSGKIKHAALDVFENEPTPRQELLTHPHISLTPHIGASTNEAQERIGVELAEKIIAAYK
ncbi:MAG: 3-phosphoglycerate dehydrogenase [Bacteroidia bacterium]|nr:3-phosphoglycerate dehydrogenase [Bacteroidia bacterium]